jgi:hypothetical protein
MKLIISLLVILAFIGVTRYLHNEVNAVGETIKENKFYIERHTFQDLDPYSCYKIFSVLGRNQLPSYTPSDIVWLHYELLTVENIKMDVGHRFCREDNWIIFDDLSSPYRLFDFDKICQLRQRVSDVQNNAFYMIVMLIFLLIVGLNY